MQFAASSFIHSRTPLVVRADNSNRHAATERDASSARKSLVAHDDENFIPLDTPTTPRLTAAVGSAQKSPCFVAAEPFTASPLSSIRVRRHAPYAPMVVHPAFLRYAMLPEAHMLQEYTALDTAVIDGHPTAMPTWGVDGQSDIHAHLHTRRACLAALLDTSAPSTIHDVSTSTAGESGFRTPTIRRRPGVPQDEFYRKYGPPPCARSNNRSRRDADDTNNNNTSITSTASSEPSDRPRPDGRAVVDTSAHAKETTRWRAPRINATLGPSARNARAEGGPVIARVQFSVRTRDFFMSADTAISCPIGAMVIVDGDRGFDAGMLVETIAHSEYGSDLPQERVHRPATREEIEVYHHQRQAAADALVKLRHLLANPTPAMLESCTADQLKSVTLLACEFQLDGGKLTVVYTASTRLRYAAIATEAFRCFHCRIWMHQLNYVATPACITPVPASEQRTCA